jgi:transcriptional regulator with XRE-family HTH domain
MGAKELGKELKKLREEKIDENGKKGVSLRDVEEITKITNAYLSMLERGAITSPSPQKLRKLANYYNASYRRLMELAEYLVKQEPESKVHMPMPVEAYFMSENLPAEEWEALAKFHQEFIRSKKNFKKKE